MTDKLHDEVFESVLAYMTEHHTHLVGTTPQWPRFDRFKVAFTMADKERILLSEAVAEPNLPKTVRQIAESIYTLNVLAVALGVDMRPIMAAVHRAHVQGDTDPNIELILDLQDPLRVAELSEG